MKKGKEELLPSQVCSPISTGDSFTANSLSIIAIYSSNHPVPSSPTNLLLILALIILTSLTTDTNNTGHITSAPANNRLQIWSLLMLIILRDIISAIVGTADIIASNAVKYYRYCQGPRLIMLRLLQHQPHWNTNPKWEFGSIEEVCLWPAMERNNCV